MYQSPYKGFNSYELVHEFVEEAQKRINPPIRGSIVYNALNSPEVRMYQSPYKGFNSR